MQKELLDILRCPFCGSTLSLEEGESLERRGEEVANGIIFCQCSAFPVVAGIPVLTVDESASIALRYLSSGAREQALLAMLGLEEEERRAAFRRFSEKGSEATYSRGLDILAPEAEAAYFIHRFSDPTYLVGEALLRIFGGDARCRAKRAIDLCGGSGHLTRVLCQIGGGSGVILADAHFWKIWLAKRFIAPECQPICCDGNNPLPLARDSCSFALCSDAFHYIWSKRQLASELARISGESGTILLSHLHNGLAENHSAGMPLAPEWWRNLLAEADPRLFKESEVFESVVARRSIDLSRNYPDEELRDEAALFLIATKFDDFFRVYEQAAAPGRSDRLRVNPLYQVERSGEATVLHLQFPSPAYEQEFGACRRYLPARVELRAGALDDPPAASANGELRELIERRVLLDLPEGYL